MWSFFWSLLAGGLLLAGFTAPSCKVSLVADKGLDEDESCDEEDENEEVLSENLSEKADNDAKFRKFQITFLLGWYLCGITDWMNGISTLDTNVVTDSHGMENVSGVYQMFRSVGGESLTCYN